MSLLRWSACRGGGDGPPGDVAEGRDAEVDRGAAGPLVELGKLLLRSGEADLEPFDFAEPGFALGLGDAGEQVAADLLDA
jgi:hypothetical protein